MKAAAFSFEGTPALKLAVGGKLVGLGETRRVDSVRDQLADASPVQRWGFASGGLPRNVANFPISRP